MSDSKLRALLDLLYDRYNQKRFIEPDPLQLVYNYETTQDREVAGLIAASFALGRVRSILDAVTKVLSDLGEPASALRVMMASEIQRRFGTYRYRFFSGHEITGLLRGIGGALKEHGSLGDMFRGYLRCDHTTTIPALTGFVREIEELAGMQLKMLADPAGGSACKRLHLYLRWMIRRDEVDPGCWDDIPDTILLVPMDVHMHRICSQIGLTRRKQPDIKASLEVTERFRSIRPDDPARYDFCLTRTGIHPEVSSTELDDLIEAGKSRPHI